MVIIQNMSWMLWGVILLISIVGCRLLKALKARPKTEREQIQRHGYQADALVLSMEEVILEDSGVAQIRLLLQVQPKEGRNFVAEIMTGPDQFGCRDIRCGSLISVKFNPFNHKQIILLDKV